MSQIKDIQNYKHKTNVRPNNPQAGIAHKNINSQRVLKHYVYDSHLDPNLDWSGKQEHSNLLINTLPVHVHERIDPKLIINNLRKSPPPGAG